jgi:parallel beta-helix repeat protein
VLVERVVASGVNDAAIYAGQCRDVVVRDSEVFGSVLGIELENTLNGAAYNNYAHDNSLGIFIVVLPQLTAKISRNTQVYDNVVVNNNIPNFADEGMAAALVPPGVGILSLAADDVEIYNNEVRDHRTTGVAIFSLTAGYDVNEIDVGPNPENNYVHNNIYSNNGYDPVAFVADLGIPTGDILWDGSGWNNRFDEPDAKYGFPLVMPRDSWGTIQKRVHWHFLNQLKSLLE